MERLRNPTRHTKLWIGVREADLLMKCLKCESCQHEGEMYCPYFSPSLCYTGMLSIRLYFCRIKFRGSWDHVKQPHSIKGFKTVTLKTI